MSCECGCGKLTNINPRNGKLRRFRCGHQGWSRPRKSWRVEESGCWTWIRSEKGNGYGQKWQRGKPSTAHRAVYEEYRGKIPEGMVLHHRCGNKMCVNPGHLEPVSTAKNIRYACHGEGTDAKQRQVDEIRRRAGKGEPAAAVARSLGVRVRWAQRVVQGACWAD